MPEPDCGRGGADPRHARRSVRRSERRTVPPRLPEEALAFEHLIHALKARSLPGALQALREDPSILPLMRMPILALGRRMLAAMGPKRRIEDLRRKVLVLRAANASPGRPTAARPTSSASPRTCAARLPGRLPLAVASHVRPLAVPEDRRGDPRGFREASPCTRERAGRLIPRQYRSEGLAAGLPHGGGGCG